jgi:hypothetical protein
MFPQHQIHTTIEEFLEVSFSVQSVGLPVYPPIVLGNNSVKVFSLQQRISGGIIFYAIHVISEESSRLDFLRTSSMQSMLYQRKVVD